jgi:hypothetical protein
VPQLECLSGINTRMTVLAKTSCNLSDRALPNHLQGRVKLRVCNLRSTLKVEAESFSEKSVIIHQTMRRHTPKCSNFLLNLHLFCFTHTSFSKHTASITCSTEATNPFWVFFLYMCACVRAMCICVITVTVRLCIFRHMYVNKYE